MLSLREYKEEYGLPTSMCLNVTDSCNMMCRYCFVNQAPHYMTLDTAIAAVEYLMKNLKRKREITNDNSLKAILNFFGGEPMLMYDEIIVPLVHYIKEKYPEDIELGITTNGTLLNKERIDFLYDNKILPLLSIDGDRETQEYNRPCVSGESSFDLVEKNIPYLLEKFPNITFRMTIYEDTCDKLFDNILYAEKMGFKYLYCTPDSRHNFSELNEYKLGLEIAKYFQYLLESLKLGIKPIQLTPINKMFVNIFKTFDLQINEIDLFLPQEIFRCGMGTVSFSVGPNGNIYACQEQVTYDKSIFLIGDITNGISKEKHLKLLEEFRTINIITCEEKEKCQNCSYRFLCKEINCPSLAKYRFDDFFIYPKTLCYWNNILYKMCNQFFIIDYNKNIEQFLLELLERVGE